MKKITALLLLAITSLSIAPLPLAHAEVGAFGFHPKFQTPVENSTIRGSRFSIGWQRHRKVVGWDLSLVGNQTTTTFIGIATSLVFNETYGDTYIVPLQLAGIWNRNTGASYIFGLQVAAGMNITGKSAKIFGFQLAGLANRGPNDIYGVQAALYNEARRVYGFQLGVVNITEELHGIQIGLINVHKNGWLKFFPVLNASF